MIEWIEYFLIGLEEMWKSKLFRHATITLLVIFMLIIFRRCNIVRQSKGHFFAPYHIADGKLYIHNAFVFRQRIIPLREIKCIRIDCLRGRSGGGKRYMLYIDNKQGKTTVIIFGKDKKNDKLIEDLIKESRRYSIKIRNLSSFLKF